MRAISGVNDHPRNSASAGFEARRAAAHDAGFWLTDELNANPGVVVRHSNQTVGGGRNPGHVSAQSYVNQPGCVAPCGSSGSGGTPGYSYSNVPVNSVTALSYDPGSWDTEITFSDGTAILGMEFPDGTLGVLEPDGTYTGYLMANGQLTPKQWYCMLTTGVPNCYVPPKYVCPYAAGAWGLLGKWGTIAAMRGKSSPLADGVGIALGAAEAQFCNAVTSRAMWKNHHRAAADFRRSFS
jgi:hypothetical protein